MPDETFRYDILINAKESIRELREMSRAAADNNQRIVEFSSFLVQKSKEWNVPLKQLLATFRQINAEMAKSKGQTIFGNVGGKNILDMSGNFLQSALAAGRFQVSANGVVSSVKSIGNAMEETDRKGKGWRHGIDLIRTALGTLTAVGIFQFLSFLTESFQTAVKAARELEDSLFRLSNVERILSQEGIDVSMKGLKNGIKEIKQLFPIFSQEDATQLVAQIAISTKEFGLQEDQIIELAKAVSILNIRSTEEETASQTAQKIISAMITDNARGIASLGLSFRENELKIKAMQMGLLDAKESVADLTSEEKAQVKYQIILENTGQELDNVSEYLDTNTAKLKENSAAWHDLLTFVGQGINNLTPDASGFFSELQKGFEQDRLSNLLTKGLRGMLLHGTQGNQLFTLTDTGIQMKLFFRAELNEEEIARLRDVLSTLDPSEIQKAFPDTSAIKDDAVRELIESFIPEVDTATEAVNNFANALDSIDTEKAQDALEDMLKKLEDLQKKMAESEQDFQLKLGRFDQDTLREREDMVEDYNLNVAQTMRQFALRRKEMEDKYRQRELQDERKFFQTS